MEVLRPRRALTVSKTVRWVNNLGIVFLNSILLRFLFPAAAAGAATFVARQGWGIFNYLDTPFWLATLFSIVAMDFVIYLQHVLVHAISVPWRLLRDKPPGSEQADPSQAIASGLTDQTDDTSPAL